MLPSLQSHKLVLNSVFPRDPIDPELCLIAGRSCYLSRAVPVWLQGGWVRAGARGEEAWPSCPSAVAVGACGALAEAITSQAGTASVGAGRLLQAEWLQQLLLERKAQLGLRGWGAAAWLFPGGVILLWSMHTCHVTLRLVPDCSRRAHPRPWISVMAAVLWGCGVGTGQDGQK